jgi:hypothetical protein
VVGQPDMLSGSFGELWGNPTKQELEDIASGVRGFMGFRLGPFALHKYLLRSTLGRQSLSTE